MKNLLLSKFLLFLPLLTSSQILLPEQEWFSLENTFDAQKVREAKIKTLSIYKQEKKDGKIFQNEKAYLVYEFYPNGLLKQAQKIIPLSRAADTASISYYYDQQQRLYKRIEKQGPFQFNYYLMYKNSKISKEVKLDGTSENSDTAYLRHYQHSEEGNASISTVLNTANKPFIKYTKSYDNEDRLIRTKTAYTKTSNFIETLYHYREQHLQTKEQTRYFGEMKKKKWKYDYVNGLPDLITLEDSRKKLFKYAIEYRKGIESAIVERDYLQKKVSIYRFSYQYFP